MNKIGYFTSFLHISLSQKARLPWLELTHCGLVTPYGDITVNTGSGNSLLPDGIKPLLEPILPSVNEAIVIHLRASPEGTTVVRYENVNQQNNIVNRFLLACRFPKNELMRSNDALVLAPFPPPPPPPPTHTHTLRQTCKPRCSYKARTVSAG